jgi:hypothetical protein
MSKKKFTEMVDRKHGVVNADITTDRTGSVYYSAANFGKIIGILITGSVADTKKAGVQLLQAKDASGTDAKNLGTAVEVVASGAQELIVTQEAGAAAMDKANGFTYAGIKVSSDNATAVIGAAAVLLAEPRYAPV